LKEGLGVNLESGKKGEREKETRQQRRTHVRS
jgi:hypothetical protein